MRWLLSFGILLAVGSLAEAESKRQVLTPAVKAELVKVFEVNEELYKAYFDYSGQKAKIPDLAKKLSAQIGMISDESIKKLLIFSQKKLGEIDVKAKKEENDQRYHLVSMALIHVMKRYDIGSDYNQYSCPMVKKQWIQNSSKVAKVQNPYMADMPSCGSKDSSL